MNRDTKRGRFKHWNFEISVCLVIKTAQQVLYTQHASLRRLDVRDVSGQKVSGMQHAQEVHRLKGELAQRSASLSAMTCWQTFVPAPP